MQINKKIILGITGEMGAGKTTVTEYIKSKHGGVSFRFSTMLRDILERMHLEHTRENLQILSTCLRSQFGDDLMSKVIAKDVEHATNNIIIVEGIRRPSDVTYLKHLPRFYLIAIDANLKTRYERIIKRNENPDDQKKTFKQFQIEQSQESEKKIRDIMKDAEIIIDNNSNKHALYADVEKIVSKYTK